MTKEFFSHDEEAQLRKLLAKQKRIQRQKKADEKFLEEADRRMDELLMRWGMEPPSLSTEDGDLTEEDNPHISDNPDDGGYLE